MKLDTVKYPVLNKSALVTGFPTTILFFGIDTPSELLPVMSSLTAVYKHHPSDFTNKLV